MTATALDYYGAPGDTWGGDTAYGGALPDHLPTLRDWGDGLYGGATYGGIVYSDQPVWMVEIQGPDGQWIDVTCDVRHITIDRGRSSWVEAFTAGTAEIVFANFTGRYSTFPPDSIWRQPGGFVTDVPIRCASILQANPPSYRFTGTTDSVEDSWPGTVDAIATVQATDAFKALARHNGGPRAAVGAGERSGARINRLADDAGFTGVRRIDTGTVALQGTTMDGVTLDLMRQVGESEWGWLYMEGDGALRFRQRDAEDTDPRMTTVQYTFTDTDDVAGACYGEATIGSDSERIVNVAQVTPPGHALSTYQDATSRSWFGPRTWTRTDLPIANDVDALGLAQLVVIEQAHDDQRIDAVVIDAANRPDNFAAAQGVRITDRIRFLRTFPGGFQLDAELIVQGRHDEVVPLGDGLHVATWTVRLQTASASAIAGLGAWDDSTFDDGMWGV